MDVFEAIETRRSVKHFDPAHLMSEAERKQLLSATILSPTSFNMQNWRIVDVRDPGKRAAIRAAAWNQAQVTDASALFVFCSNLNAHAESPERYWANAPEKVREMLVPMITGFYADKSALQRDEGIRSIGIAAQTLMLAARGLGYDSNPMIGFDPEKVAEVIELPPKHLIGLIVAVGKALQPAMPRGGQLSLPEVSFVDTFPRD